MSPLPLDQRIVAACRLGPLSIRQLARMLDATWRTVYRHVQTLHDAGCLSMNGHTRGLMGAPAIRWVTTQ